jgi:nicotinamidase/pyrazinamidase
MMNVHLLIIDPQNDFCDPERGALYVNGADADMERVSVMVDRLRGKLSDIHVTLDSHHPIDIAHPVFWKDSAGQRPAPFTQVSVEDVRTGRWTTRLPSARARAIEYLEALEKGGRYPHTVWPPHCLIGSYGHNVMPKLFEALTGWEAARFAVVDYVTKGSNLWTEHFSAVQAEVPDPMDPGTQVNSRLVETLEEADLVLLAGEAGSHCLANTVRDIADRFTDARYISKLVLLTDATSPVTGFEAYQEDFIRDMTARGMKHSTTTEVLA